MMPIFHAFVSLIFYKIMVDMMFQQSLTVIAAILMAIIGAAVNWAATVMLLGTLGTDRIEGKPIGPSVAAKRAWAAFTCAGVALVAINTMIVFGFSKKLWREIGRDFSAYNSDYLFFWFAVVCVIPLIVSAVVIYKMWVEILAKEPTD